MSVRRAEVIGSMLRPPYLHEANERRKAGALSASEFKALEDRAVDECIAIQERAGVDVVTDGEMRRRIFASQLAQASEGFGPVQGHEVDWYDVEGKLHRVPIPYGVVGKIRRKRHLSSEEFVYLRRATRRPTKITLPSPTMYAYNWVPGVTDAVYSSTDSYLADVTDILRDEVAELARLGATYIQFDAPEFGMLLNPHQQDWFARKGFRASLLVEQGIAMMNAIIASGPGDVTFGLHVCRGNRESWYMASGSYGSLARTVFAQTRARVLLLEYDDERSGDFAPLAAVPEDKVVVLGLVTTKTPRAETPEELRARIREAVHFVPLERLALSTQCGFASVAKGNAIGFETQERKLRLVAEVARDVWGAE